MQTRSATKRKRPSEARTTTSAANGKTPRTTSAANGKTPRTTSAANGKTPRTTSAANGKTKTPRTTSAAEGKAARTASPAKCKTASAKGKTPRTTSAAKGKPPRIDDSSRRPPLFSGAGKNKVYAKRQGISRKWCREIREKIEEAQSKGKKLSESFQLKCGHRLRHFSNYSLSDEPNFDGLVPPEESMKFNGVPVLPSDIEDFDSHLREIIWSRRHPDDILLCGNYSFEQLGRELCRSTIQKVDVSAKVIQSFDFTMIVRQARSDANRRQQDKTDNRIAALIQNQNALTQSTNVLVGGVQTLADTQKSMLETQNQHGRALQDHGRILQHLDGNQRELSTRVDDLEQEWRQFAANNGDVRKSYQDLTLSAKRDYRHHYCSPQRADFTPTKLYHQETSPGLSPLAVTSELIDSPSILQEMVDSKPAALKTPVVEAGLEISKEKVDSKPASLEPAPSNAPVVEASGFDLRLALVQKLRDYVTAVNAKRSHGVENMLIMDNILQKFCPDLNTSMTFKDGNKIAKLDTTTLTGLNLTGGEEDIQKLRKMEDLKLQGKSQLDITGALNLLTIPADDVKGEDPDKIMFLPSVRVLPQSDISNIIPLLFEHNNPNISLVYSLIVCIEDDDVKFMIYRDQFPVEEDTPIYDANREQAHRNATYIASALGCVVEHSIKVTLSDEDDTEVALVIATRAEDDDATSARSPLAQMMVATSKMNDASVVKFSSSAKHNECKPIPFNSRALNSILTAGKRVVFDKVHFFEPGIWKAARGEIEFKSCIFHQNIFYKPTEYAMEHLTLQVTFSHLNDLCLKEPVKFLDNIITAVDQGRINKVFFNHWDCSVPSSPVIDKLAELHNKLSGGLELKALDFSSPHPLMTKNIMKAIAERNAVAERND